MTAYADERLAYRARRIDEGKRAELADLEISFGVEDHNGHTVNTMIVGPFTVYENMVGIWSGHAQKMGRQSREAYGRYDEEGGYSRHVFWQMGCSEIVHRILWNLPAEATRQVFPQVAHLRGYELAYALRKLVLAQQKQHRRRKLISRLRLPFARS